MDSITILFNSDTLQYAMSSDSLIIYTTATPIKIDSGWDIGCTIAMCLIAIANFIFTIYLFHYKKNENTRKETKTEKKELLNNLVLEHKLIEFYEFYKEILMVSSSLLSKEKDSMEEKKKDLDDKYQDLFTDFRLNFIESLSAIDENLYKNILGIADDLHDILTNNLFDEGVNLNVTEKYNELIKNPILKAQRDILSALYKYE